MKGSESPGSELLLASPGMSAHRPVWRPSGTVRLGLCPSFVSSLPWNHLPSKPYAPLLLSQTLLSDESRQRYCLILRYHQEHRALLSPQEMVQEEELGSESCPIQDANSKIKIWREISILKTVFFKHFKTVPL